MAFKDFVHLHVHSEYSLLDGAIRLKDLVKTASAAGIPAVALTDHGTMFGAIDFYQTAMKEGVKPIIGQECYLTPGSRHDRTQGQSSNYHLTLLASNEVGYRNLMRLSSIGYLEGFYYKPRIDWEVLERHKEGLIVLSGCLKGEISQTLLKGDYTGALAIGAKYRDLLGKDNFYVEIQDQGLLEQRTINPAVIKLARELNVKLVATNDCHYLRRADAKFHEILLCIQTGKKLADTDRMKFSSDEFYLKSPEEMQQRFIEIPQALQSTVEIAERCSVKISFGTNILPRYEVPEGYDEISYMKHLCFEGLTARFQESGITDPSTQDYYRARLEMELAVIVPMGFAAYFLIVWDFINYSRRQGIPVGPGRGSAAGSLVAYAMRITNIDPIKYNLLFERFLNPERVSMPDIDVDFCVKGRDQVIQYVYERYGADRVAQIVTFGTMAARAVIRDVGRVMDFSYGEVDRIAKLVPEVLNISLTDAIKQEPELKKLMDNDQRISVLLEASMALEGLSRHSSTHAAAVVISKDPLTEVVPLTRDPRGGLLNLTQYSMNFIAALGLLKMDFLGLRNLTILENAVNVIKQTRGIKLELEQIPLDDKKTYELLSHGDTVGVFQFESGGMREYLRQLKPSVFEDLIAMVALYRPGPMDSIGTFINCKHGREQAEFLHPDLKPILQDTYGVIVYQEQIMQIARAMAGFSYGQADILRKAVSKKKADAIAEMKEKFVQGMLAKGHTKDLAEKIFAFIEPFARYGFNKSHAAPYALIAYQTAYLKSNYATEFMASLLTADIDHTDKVLKSISECRSMGIEILPPDVNDSFHDFTVIGQAIRFGLAAVKSVGSNAVAAVLDARKARGPFTSLYDFCERVDLRAVNRRVVENLIKCGAFDSLSSHRAQMLEVLDQALEAGQSAMKDRLSGQKSLFGLISGTQAKSLGVTVLPDVPEWSSTQKLQAEKEALGFFITGHPLLRYKRELRNYANTTSSMLCDFHDEDSISIAGLVVEVKKFQTKKQETMGIVNFEDLEGFYKVVLRAKEYEQFKELLDLDMTPLLVKGTMELSDRGTSVICHALLKLEDARKNLTHTMTVNLPVEATTRDQLLKLREVIAEHRGSCQVYLNFLYPGTSSIKNTIVKLPDDLAITPDNEIQEQIERMFGESCLIFG